MQEYSLMEMFSNPELFGQLSMGDKLAGAGITTLMGMGITFCVLILLWGIIACMARILNAADRTKAAAPALQAAAPAAVSAPAAAAITPAAAANQEDANLIAVIAAATAAYEGNGVTSNLIVRKINRISGSSTTWSSAGNSECIDSRRM